NCEVFCSASRRNDRRIVNYVTVIATHKPDKRQSKVGKLFLVGCLRTVVNYTTQFLPPS
ncbi:MAG: hypothetical protein BECKG1743D_GA0114223_107171, partial [Candidatus Kentron sp. G]